MHTLTVGQTETLSVVYLDQHGNPMQAQPIPDATPTWTHDPGSPADDTLTPNGAQATLTAITTGSDTVSVALSVGGIKFTASESVSLVSSTSANVILFGIGQAHTTLASAVSAAQAGDIVRAGSGMSGVVLSESVSSTVPITIDGGGVIANAGTPQASFSGGVVLDGSGLVDPSGYSHQLGGIVPVADCTIRGFEIRGFGMNETSSGLTSAIRNGAAGRFTVDNCWLHDNQVGIGSGGFTASWTVTNTLLHENGIGDGRSHNMYFSTVVTSVTMAGGVTSIVDPLVSSSLSATGTVNGGHALKTRAPALTISGTNYFRASDATPIDVPDGTTTPFSITSGTTIAKLAADPNHGVFGYAVESQTNGAAGGTFSGVTFDIPCANPSIQTSVGTITLDSSCSFLNGTLSAQGSGTVVGL